MRRETLKAIEQARDNLISNLHYDRKGGSKMQHQDYLRHC